MLFEVSSFERSLRPLSAKPHFFTIKFCFAHLFSEKIKFSIDKQNFSATFTAVNKTNEN